MMKCWRCGKENTDGAGSCVYCGVGLMRQAPRTAPGRAMRELYDHYGAEEIFMNKAYLVNGLGDLLEDSGKLRNRIKMAADAGIFSLYKEQLPAGKPDSDFYARVRLLMEEDAGLSEKACGELISFMDEMIGWPLPEQEEDRSGKESGEEEVKPESSEEHDGKPDESGSEAEKDKTRTESGPEEAEIHPTPKPANRTGKEKVLFAGAAAILLALIPAAVYGLQMSAVDALHMDMAHKNPGILGDSCLGYDIAKLLLYGTPRHMWYVLLSAVICTAAGILPGLLAGKASGRAGTVLDRGLRILCGAPNILLFLLTAMLFFDSNSDTGVVFGFLISGIFYVIRAVRTQMQAGTKAAGGRKPASFRTKEILRALAGCFFGICSLFTVYMTLAGFLGLDTTVAWGLVMSGMVTRGGFNPAGVMSELSWNFRTVAVPAILTILAAASFRVIGLRLEGRTLRDFFRV